MNKKKILGLLCWLIAFAIPFQSALLNTESVGNIQGLISFVILIGMVFIGYALVDSSDSKRGETSGHH